LGVLLRVSGACVQEFWLLVAAASVVGDDGDLRSETVWNKGGGCWCADPALFPDFVGRRRRICGPAGTGVFPGRRATEIWSRRYAAGGIFGSQSLSSDGALPDLGVLVARLPPFGVVSAAAAGGDER
jgi:hypothetical protein